MKEELTAPWYQALVCKDVDGHSSISHQRSYDDRPLNVVRTQSTFKNIDVELLYECVKQLHKYYKQYDPKGFFKEWKYINEPKIDESGKINSTIYCIFSLGPMCSNRLSVYNCEMVRDPQNPKRFIMDFWTQLDHPCPDGCIAAKFYKRGYYEQVGNDVIVHECQTMDLKGYFPKSLMNKLQASLTSDNAKATYEIMKTIRAESG